MKPTYLFVLVLALVFTSCSKEESFENEQDLFESTATLSMTSSEEELFNLVNEYRIDEGYTALMFSSEAYVVAEDHNKYMIKKNKISHDNFNTRATKLKEKANAVFVAENVARDFTTNSGVLNAWLNSATHKRTLEGDYTHTAIKITVDSTGKPYFTQLFFRK